jgi:hypothetical protein
MLGSGQGRVVFRGETSRYGTGFPRPIRLHHLQSTQEVISNSPANSKMYTCGKGYLTTHGYRITLYIIIVPHICPQVLGEVLSHRLLG